MEFDTEGPSLVFISIANTFVKEGHGRKYGKVREVVEGSSDKIKGN